MSNINIEEANLPELVNKVINGQEFLIMREGEPVARLLPIAGGLNRFPDLSEFRASIAPSNTSASEYIAQMRDDEDEKLG